MDIKRPKNYCRDFAVFVKCLLACSQRPYVYLIVACAAASTVALSASQHKAEGTVEAERFVVRDRDGKKRIELAAENGRSVQTFFDKDGKPRILFGVDESGNAGIDILSSDGKLRLDFGLDSDGSANVSGYGEANDKAPRLSMKIDKDGSPSVFLFDTKDNDRIGLYVAADNSVGLTIHDSDSKLIFHQGDRGKTP